MDGTIRKVPININIAGFPMPLEVAMEEQDHIRDTERRINAIFSDWEKKYPHKSAAQLLAMLTFRFASFYYSQRDRDAGLAKRMDDMAGMVSDLLSK